MFSSLSAQLSFMDMTDSLLVESDVKSGVAIAIADINNDGMDDIIRLDSTYILQVEYQKINGQKFASYKFGEVTVADFGEWAITVGDVNNDGFNDIMTGGLYNQIKLLTYNPSTFGLDLSIMPNSGIFLQGANFADINNDGWVDYFGCHDDGPSRIWENDGAGNFALNNDWINFIVDPSSDNSGNYGSVWTDFDNDHDLDLYIAKCRQGVNDATDARRINILFENDGNGGYTETAEKHGLKIGHQSWTADFQDIDNDGDFDCFITNHDYKCQILENDGAGNFTDITEQTGIDISGNFLQGIMRDFDNDGFVDIITSGPCHYFKNNGNKTFSPAPNQFTITNPNSLVVGDLNQDGFIDVYATYPNGINQMSNKPDKLFINQGMANHNYLAVNLEGIQSNKKGIGARIEIHGSWGIQVREVRAGESYGISTSLTQHFGIGTSTEIEYLMVRWPSGIVDVIQNPGINQFLTVVENTSCQNSQIQLGVSGNTILCPGESVQISAPAGYSYFWNNGSNQQFITADGPGNFSAILIDVNGCVSTSNVINIQYAPNETPTLSLNGSTNLCDGETVTISSSQANSYTWNTGETSQSIEVGISGEYQVVIEGTCEDWTSEPVTIEVFDVGAIPMVENDTIFAPGNAVLTASGANPTWYETEDSMAPLGTGNSFETPFIEETTTFFVSNNLGYGGGSYSTGMPEHQGSEYGTPFHNGELHFDVGTDLIIKRVVVFTDTYGERKIQLKNALGDVLQEKLVDIQTDSTTLELDFDLSTGQNYVLTTDGDFNLTSIGQSSPRFKRSNDGVTYPYSIDNVINIHGSDVGSGFYYYFYAWEIEVKPTIVCPSERVPVQAVMEFSYVLDHDQLIFFEVFPNPNNGIFSVAVESKLNGAATFQIIDVFGKVLDIHETKLLKYQTNHQQFDLSDLPKGVYYLSLKKENNLAQKKLVIH